MPIVKSLLSKVCLHGPTNFLPESSNIPAWPTFDPYDASLNEHYRYRKQIGVNLGSLFALESWLCPDELKKATKKDWASELDFLASCHDHQQARDLLERHWTTFITANDIATLATWGINTVRIPIGYWIVEPRKLLADHPHDGFFSYADVYDAALANLMQLVWACEQHQLGVLIDIHGAPGGQNNDAHCGQHTPCSNCHFFSGLHASSNQTCLLIILQRLTELLSPINNIVGIELLNEPIDHSSLPKFYERACRTVVAASSSHRPLPIYVGDCWQPAKYMDIIAHQLSSHHPFVVLDTHQYFCHTPADHRLTAQQNTAKVKDKVGSFLDRQGPTIRRNIVVGEWAMVLNGASMKGMDERQTMMDFGSVQAEVWDKTCAGQFYWTYKTADDKWYWSFVYCYQQGLLPWLKQRQSRQGGLPVDGYLKENITAHLNYWKTQLGEKDPKAYQAIEQHVWMYEKGFKAGFEIGLRFAQQVGAQVGFKAQLAKDYRMEEKWGDDVGSFAWQYEQAFIQAIDTVERQ
ncbi:glycoside hydrolase superfamily [Chlamydoabsidia padenii]|nr:glycoside hydrolase superfamily [Chlamydoabsidia padenii]